MFMMPYLACTRGSPAWLVQVFIVSARDPWGPEAGGQEPSSTAATWGDVLSWRTWKDPTYLDVEEKVILGGGLEGTVSQVEGETLDVS